jgi:hypothetical protein
VNLPSFSQVGRAIACPASVALPHVETTNEHAEAGTRRHAFLAHAVTYGREAALAEFPAESLQMSHLRLDQLLAFFDGCGPLRSETAFAYDPFTDTARELGENLGRQYSRNGAEREREICGALDLFAPARDAEEMRILDMKGRGAGDPWQLRTQALAVARAYGVTRAVCAFAYYQDDGSFILSRPMTLTALDLDEYAMDLSIMVGAARAADAKVQKQLAPDVSEGDHCQWCKAERYCPAKTALIRSASSDLATLPQTIGALTMEQRAAAYQVVRRYLPLLENVEKAIKASALAEPIDLGDGRVLMGCPGYENIDEQVATDIISSRVGTIEANEATTRKITKASIERALGAQAPAVIEAIRAAGGITEGPPIVRAVKRR